MLREIAVERFAFHCPWCMREPDELRRLPERGHEAGIRGSSRTAEPNARRRAGSDDPDRRRG